MRRSLVGLCAMALLSGCSDATAPGPGSFRARLSGVRMGVLSGESNGSAFFGVEYPDARFAIRMFDVEGDHVRALVLHCPGESPPTAGSYNVSGSDSECRGTYSRVRTTQGGGITILEQAQASSGQLTITGLDANELSGSFNFQGTLVVGSDPGGTLLATGSFSSTIAP